MRTRFMLPVGGLCALVPLVYFLLPRVPERPDNIGEYSDWKPNPADIAAEIGSGPGGSFSDERHQQFARMFQQRFRGKEFAIAFRFTNDDRVRLSCAAVIPRWDMARVASSAHDEIKQLFGKSVIVDIFETYISIRPRKLAELHEDPAKGRVTVTFDPKYAAEEVAATFWTRFPAFSYFDINLYASGAFWDGPNLRRRRNQARPLRNGFPLTASMPIRSRPMEPVLR